MECEVADGFEGAGKADLDLAGLVSAGSNIFFDVAEVLVGVFYAENGCGASTEAFQAKSASAAEQV